MHLYARHAGRQVVRKPPRGRPGRYDAGAMTAPTDQHDDELGPPAFEDLSDEARERDLEQGHRAAIETAIAQLRAGDPDTARRTLAARLDEAERCPICGVRDGEACNASTHERAELEGSTQGTTQ